MEGVLLAGSASQASPNIVACAPIHGYNNLTKRLTNLHPPCSYFDPDFEEAGRRCFKCGGRGHMARDCTNAAKERPCFLCAQLGHDSRDCPSSECLLLVLFSS